MVSTDFEPGWEDTWEIGYPCGIVRCPQFPNIPQTLGLKPIDSWHREHLPLCRLNRLAWQSRTSAHSDYGRLVCCDGGDSGCIREYRV